VSGEKYKLLCSSASADAVKESYDNLYKSDVRFLAYSDVSYPEKLKQKEVLPPPGLFYKGDVSLLNTTSVAVVGTRKCSSYGEETASKFGGELCDYNITVVSGLADGIDAYAHKAALAAGGKTIGVLGTGHNRFYPRINDGLYRQICKTGLVVSEYPPDSDGAKYTFPERNRIISALSDAVIIIEASENSGALITSDRALEQGKEIFAVPGNITSPKSQGTNTLIKNGANLLSGMQDILRYFSIKNTKISKEKPSFKLDNFEEKIYNLLEIGETDFDGIAAGVGLKTSEIITSLLSMEVKGAVKRLKNNNYRRVEL
jgi:DNA processing protein